MSRVVYQLAYDNILERLRSDFYKDKGRLPNDNEELRMESSITEDDLRDEVEYIESQWDSEVINSIGEDPYDN